MSFPCNTMHHKAESCPVHHHRLHATVQLPIRGRKCVCSWLVLTWPPPHPIPLCPGTNSPVLNSMCCICSSSQHFFWSIKINLGSFDVSLESKIISVWFLHILSVKYILTVFDQCDSLMLSFLTVIFEQHLFYVIACECLILNNHFTLLHEWRMQ